MGVDMQGTKWFPNWERALAGESVKFVSRLEDTDARASKMKHERETILEYYKHYLSGHFARKWGNAHAQNLEVHLYVVNKYHGLVKYSSIHQLRDLNGELKYCRPKGDRTPTDCPCTMKRDQTELPDSSPEPPIKRRKN